MIPDEPLVGSSQEGPIPVSETRRERVVVRRRRAQSRPQAGQWTARRPRRKILRAVFVCTGVLLLMAVGLYLGLARQDIAPAESKLHGSLLAASGASGLHARSAGPAAPDLAADRRRKREQRIAVRRRV